MSEMYYAPTPMVASAVDDDGDVVVGVGNVPGVAAGGLRLPAGGATGNPNKRGHSCCGGCCDMRRAVIICNFIMIILVVFKIIFWEILGWAAQVDMDADDDSVKEAGEQLSTLLIGFLVFVAIVQVVCYGVAIYGSISFNQTMILVGLVCYCMMIAWHLITYTDFITFIVQISLSLGFAYPHYFMYKEMKDQIMTPENYPNEVQSCCCVA